MTVTALPPAPSRTDSPSTFVARADALLGALPTFVTEFNAALLAVLAADGGLPISLPFTFSTTTSGDPGAGGLRLNNATQAAATGILIDYTTAAAGNPTIELTLLPWLDNSTSACKGIVKLYETGTPANYLYFSLTSTTDSTGYYTLNVAPLAKSADNPFGISDAITFQFWPTGDAGSYAGGSLANAAITNVKTVTFNSEVSTGGAASGSIAIDWSAGALYKQIEPTGICNFTYTDPPGPCHLQLRIISDGASSAYAHTFQPTTPKPTKWLGSTWAAVANKSAIISFYYDGATYWAQGVNEV